MNRIKLISTVMGILISTWAYSSLQPKVVAMNFSSSGEDWLLESSAKPLDIDTSQSVVICYDNGVCVVYGG